MLLFSIKVLQFNNLSAIILKKNGLHNQLMPGGLPRWGASLMISSSLPKCKIHITARLVGGRHHDLTDRPRPTFHHCLLPLLWVVKAEAGDVTNHDLLLATLVALHFTPVIKSISISFKLA